MRRGIALTPVVAAIALTSAAHASAAPAERQLTARSATALLPSVLPVGRMRATERSASIRVRTVADATVRVEFQIYCFDRQVHVHRLRRVAQGKGTVTASLRRPRGRGLDCSASASVRTTGRPAPASGVPTPVRLSAAIYARRR